jgi:uncharacterized protein YfaQ (DUF2300 family)
LFVYAWLVDTGAREAAYECRGQSKEEVYCCTAGGKIERDQALVKSCGLYFEPARLGISSADWRAYWQTRQAPEWLLSLPSLQPATRVPVACYARWRCCRPRIRRAGCCSMWCSMPQTAMWSASSAAGCG